MPYRIFGHFNREVHLRTRSPIQLLPLLQKNETNAFIHEIENGPQIDHQEVTILFNVASKSGNGLAICALAERYPTIVNDCSLSDQFNKKDIDAKALAQCLKEVEDKAPPALLACFNEVPTPGVTKVYSVNEQQKFKTLLHNIGDNATTVIVTNGESDDRELAVFVATRNRKNAGSKSPDRPETPIISAKNDNAKAMEPELLKLLKARGNLQFRFPNHFSPADEVSKFRMK